MDGKLLTGVAEASNRLLIMPDHSQAIAEALAIIGKAAAVDRVYICQIHLAKGTGKMLASRIYEWCETDIKPSSGRGEQNIAYDALGFNLYEYLAAGKAWTALTRQLPEPCRHKLQAEGILSLILVPIMIETEFWGFIGFDDCKTERRWSQNQQAILATLAAGIGGAIKHQHILEELHKSQALLEVFFSQSMSGCFFMMLDQPVRWDATVDKEAVLAYVFTHLHLTRVNNALLEQYRAKSEQLLGCTPADLYAGDLESGWAIYRQLFDYGRLHVDKPERRFDGSEMWVEADYTCLYDADGNITGHFGIQRDITDRRQAEEQIKYQAYHDALTGLPNRFLFHDRLSVALAQAERSHRLVALMFLDIDGFKEINDTLGHAAGDCLLQKLAARLQACVRHGDTVARMGGDEFTIILPALKDAQAAYSVAERIIETMRQPLNISGCSITVTTSIGISFYPTDGSDIQLLMRKADRAMYRAKLSGRNNYQAYSSGDIIRSRE